MNEPARPLAVATPHPPSKIPLTLTINGVERRLEVAPWTNVLDLLREYLDLTRKARCG